MTGSVQGALFGQHGASTAAAATASSAGPVATSSETSPAAAKGSRKPRTRSVHRKGEYSASDGHAGCVTARSGDSALPPSRRKPGAKEREFLRQHRLVYHRPELFPNETLELCRLALSLGFRHPLTSLFAWPTTGDAGSKAGTTERGFTRERLNEEVKPLTASSLTV